MNRVQWLGRRCAWRHSPARVYIKNLCSYRCLSNPEEFHLFGGVFLFSFVFVVFVLVVLLHTTGLLSSRQTRSQR